MPGAARGLLFALLAALAPAVAVSSAGAAGHTDRLRVQRGPDVGIVDIYTKLGYEGSEAAGTGMLLTRSGEVLTNNHVIEGATSFRVVDVTTHRKYTATVVGYSVVRDVAVLKLAHASHLQTIALGRSARLRVGQAVVVRGNALGRGGKPAATGGKVTALHRQVVASDGPGGAETLSNLIVTNARVRPGESGGALQNAQGQTVGMVTAGSAGAGHRGYAIPITQALGVARLVEGGISTATVHVGPTAFLGVVVRNAGGGGAAVTQVVPGSAAAAAGLVAGDVITSLNGITISSRADVRRAVLSLVPGTAVPIGWTDTDGNAQTGTVTPAGGPPQ